MNGFNSRVHQNLVADIWFFSLRSLKFDILVTDDFDGQVLWCSTSLSSSRNQELFIQHGLPS